MKIFLKKLAIYFTTISTIIGLNCAILEVANVANAVTDAEIDQAITEADSSQASQGETSNSSGESSPIDKLLYHNGEGLNLNLFNQEDAIHESTANYLNLTDKSFLEITASLIRTMLYLVSSLTVIALIVVGVLYLTGSLSEDNVTKAKKIFGYIGIAIILISGSYGIITGILKINFFE